MKFFDTGRALNASDHKLLSNGTIIPSIHLEPEEDGSGAWHLMVMVRTSFRGHTWKHATITDLNDFGQKWIDDPEKTLIETFGYDVTAKVEDEPAPTTVRAQKSDTPTGPLVTAADLDI